MIYDQPDTADIFTVKSKVLVNPVNCFGISGKGLALEFKKNYPKNFEFYNKVCTSKDSPMKPGCLLPFKEKGVWIVNAATKYNWQSPSKIEWIEMVLDNLSNYVFIQSLGIKKGLSISIPALGCGLGGLKYKFVWHLVHKHCKDIDGAVYFFPPKKEN